ncbi:Tetraspanin-11 [Holothuria leucospilota]|uniref:Tetraspanin n=1 Tax=Holothuria leucospilota TaxID=206669 RepID=A0A9Q0YRR3_HOLLE|nr:Tetraspanin-11 [Holothuria leucospilota]
MVAGCGPKLAKLLLFIVNFSVWAGSLALIGLGIWMLVESSRFDTLFAEDNIKPIAGIILGLGCFLFIVGFCGCCGAMKESTCYLNMYFTFLLLIVLGELTAGILVFVYSDEIESSMTRGMTSTIKNDYGVTDAATESVDYFQKEFECCGASNYTDYSGSKFEEDQGVAGALPDTCCPKDTVTCSVTSDAQYKEGCVSASLDKLQSNYAIVGGICLGILAIEICAMIFSCCMVNAIKEDK